MLKRKWKPTPPRRSSDWKVLLPFSLFILAWSITAIALDLAALAAILTILGWPTTFMAGYLYRADSARRGGRSRRPFLQVEGD